MGMNTFEFCMGIFVLLILIAMAIFGGYSIATEEDQINGEVVECYDKKGNIIVGNTCVVKGAFDSEKQQILFGIMFSVAALVFIAGMSYFFFDMLNSTRMFI